MRGAHAPRRPASPHPARRGEPRRQALGQPPDPRRREGGAAVKKGHTISNKAAEKIAAAELRALAEAGLIEQIGDAWRLTEKGKATDPSEVMRLSRFNPFDVTIRVETYEQEDWVRRVLLGMLHDRGMSSRETLARPRR